MKGLLLDTHIWLWVQKGDAGKLSRSFIQELEDRQRESQLFLSAISVLEIARLVAFNGYSLGQSVDSFVEEASTDGGLQLLDLSPRILIDSTRLPGEFNRDPSDRLLAATARAHGLTLITQDKPMLNYAKAGHLNARKP